MAVAGIAGDQHAQHEEPNDGGEHERDQLGRLVAGPIRPVVEQIMEATANRRRLVGEVVPHARQQRARQPFQQIAREQRVPEHRDALDQLAGAHPGQLGGLDGAVELGGQRVETRAIGRDRRALGRRVLAGHGAELLDLRAHRGELGPQVLRRLDGLAQDLLDVEPETPQLVLELAQLLQRLLGRLDGRRQLGDRLLDLLGQDAGRGLRLSLLLLIGGRGRLGLGGRRANIRQRRRGQEQGDEQERREAPVTRHDHSLTACPKVRG